MQAAHSGAATGIESDLLDLGGVSLTRLRTLDSGEMRNAVRHAVERVAYIPVTASEGEGGGAKRVD